MNEEQSIFELIEKYHQGLLSEEEKALFEKRMQTDAAFAEYVHVNDMANTVIYTSGMDMLREQMTQDLIAIDKKSVTRRYQIGAGVVALLVGLSSLIYFTKQTGKGKTPIQTVPAIEVPQDSSAKETTISATVIPNKNNITTNTEREQVDAKQLTDTANTNSIVHAPSTKLETTIPTTISVNEKIENTSQTKIKENNKPSCNLSFDVIVKTTCKGERNGSIVVDQKSISGGEGPYSFRISTSSKAYTTGSFLDLAEGSYTVSMYDRRLCNYSKEVVVFGTTCNTKKSYSFNPDYGEGWKIPFVEDASGSFTLYNRAGMTIFKGNFDPYATIEWNGTNTQGTVVDTGLYVCVIEYSTGKIEKIEVSVVR